MRTITIFYLVCCPIIVFCQLSNSKDVLLDSAFNKPIRNEGQTYSTRFVRLEEKKIGIGTIVTNKINVIDTVAADLVVNYDTKKGDDDQIYIKSSNAQLRGDTLVILLFNHGSYIFWEYRILIIKGVYQIETWFTPPINEKKIQILPITTVLKINSTDFSKGRQLIGYTKLEGQCKGDNQSCFSRDIIIEGNFKVRIE